MVVCWHYLSIYLSSNNDNLTFPVVQDVAGSIEIELPEDNANDFDDKKNFALWMLIINRNNKPIKQVKLETDWKTLSQIITRWQPDMISDELKTIYARLFPYNIYWSYQKHTFMIWKIAIFSGNHSLPSERVY